VNTPSSFIRLRLLVLAAAVATLTAAALPALAPAAGSPAWNLRVIPMPTNFAPGAKGTVNRGPRFNILATNVGGATAAGPVTITDTLPVGLMPTDFSEGCSAVGQTVTCTLSAAVEANGTIRDTGFGVEVDPGFEDPTTLVDEATIESPGAAPQTAATAVTITDELAPFGLLEGDNGLSALLSEEDGSAATGAGSHPSQLTVDLALNTKPGMVTDTSTTALTSGGGLRDMRNYLAAGLIVNPGASGARCTEAQLETTTCPNAAGIGRGGTLLSFAGFPFTTNDALYNLVPPPGYPAAFGFNPFGTGIYVHVLGGVRPGDYTLSATTPDIPNLFNHMLYSAELQIWGDPSSPSHDLVRGHCGNGQAAFPPGTVCSVDRQEVAMISLPTNCQEPMALEAEYDSWGKPGEWLDRSIPFTDLEGAAADEVSGCNALQFDPTLSARPTTNLADSPSGLDVDLAIPQSEKVAGGGTAHLKAATVALPEGLVVNPSSANGLEGCSPEQVGIDPATGLADGTDPSCPNASRIGTVEVETPLLAQYDSEGNVERDPDGNTIAEPVGGSVYLASPHENPFGSLLAIYVVFEDKDRGILVKLAGKVSPDPQTGRLTTSFEDNPQLPFSHFKLHFFGGAAAPLRTPLACGAKTTGSVLTPWSEPEGAAVSTTDSFQISASPAGGCASSEAAAPGNVAFSAGTIAPQAGAYSPLVLKLAREDGTQPIASIDTTLPPGLTGKLAGIAYCPEGALAAAAAKSGRSEQGSPSCPADSEVGSVNVGAGAGPAPYYTQGKAYLAGPYKGAPLSLAIVTPAVAGPYDLGTVVVRTALYVDPETARIRAVSDPIPQILEGIPLDVRSIALRMDRPDFTLNPTSCDPMALSGSASSPFGSVTSLSSSFQVGGCQTLPFKPKLVLRLKGGTTRSAHPALSAVLTARPGEANIARTVVALPHSEFLDQGHIRTVCTRVQFAAEQCPARSVYGKATAVTPLLAEPLSGPVYLRSNGGDRELPDLVADLRGQIHITLVGYIDSLKGGIRTSFEGVPDAPVSKFVLQMQGGKKGLIVNSRNICKAENRADVQMDGQNGKAYGSTPKLLAKCKGGKKGRR
jgi:hypothetical protein